MTVSTNCVMPSILLSHPAKQHAYQVAFALQKAGLLRRFVTGIYYKPNGFPYLLLNWLPAAWQTIISRQLTKRRLSALRDDLIVAVPYFEALSRTIGGFS